jgi:hypothetical protein
MDLTGIQAIVAGSNTINTWSLSIIGGTILAILSTSYVKPMQRWGRLIYLLFIPGWVFLLLSIQNNSKITGRGIMATLMPEKIPSIVEKMNDEFANQIYDFKVAIILFSIWLILYLIWWIFQDFSDKIKTNE